MRRYGMTGQRDIVVPAQFNLKRYYFFPKRTSMCRRYPNPAPNWQNTGRTTTRAGPGIVQFHTYAYRPSAGAADPFANHARDALPAGQIRRAPAGAILCGATAVVSAPGPSDAVVLIGKIAWRRWPARAAALGASLRHCAFPPIR